jgi:hypothetical protein
MLDSKDSETKEPESGLRVATIDISSEGLKLDSTSKPYIKNSSSPVISIRESQAWIAVMNFLSTYLKRFLRPRLQNGNP